MRNICKNFNLTVTALALGSFLMLGCEDPNQARADKEFGEYSDFVENESSVFDNENDWEWEEYDRNWRKYDSAYQQHLMGVEENKNYLSDENRAEFNRMQKEYEERKSRYEGRAANEGSGMDEHSISGRMYSSVNITNPANVDFSNATASNMRTTYKNFVDYVDAHKSEMTAADWRNAEIIWEAMNLRKNEVEADISTKDNLAIGTLKAEYGALKSSYGLVENIKDTSGAKKHLGDVTDKMEDRNNNPKN